MSRNNGWFRFYDRMIDSPQVLELNDTEFRLLVSIWCLASASETRGMLPFSPRALQRRVLPDRGVEEIAQMLAHLIDLNLVATLDNGAGYSIVNWDEHQYEHASWTPAARREQKRKERQSDVATMSQGRRNNVASGRNIDTEGEEDTETEGEPQPPASSSPDDMQQRQHQRARAHTHEGALTDSPTEPREPPQEPPTGKRLSLPAFRQQFADAVGLSPGERGQELDAIIAAYRPRAPDAELIVEAHSCRTFYGGKRTKRQVDCRLLANWLARWADQRAERQRQQQQPREDTAEHANTRRAVAAGAGGRGRRPVDLPDPTRNGRYAHLVQTISDDDE